MIPAWLYRRQLPIQRATIAPKDSLARLAALTSGGSIQRPQTDWPQSRRPSFRLRVRLRSTSAAYAARRSQGSRRQRPCGEKSAAREAAHKTATTQAEETEITVSHVRHNVKVTGDLRQEAAKTPDAASVRVDGHVRSHLSAPEWKANTRFVRSGAIQWS
jgi:hypothetical protein